MKYLEFMDFNSFPKTGQDQASIVAELSRGEQLQSAGELSAAADIYRNVLSVRPDLSRTAYNLGIILNELQQYGEAEMAFRQAFNGSDEFFEAEFNLNFTLQELGRIDEALRGYSALLERYPDLPDVRFNLACLQLLTGDTANGWPGYGCRFDTISGVKRRHEQIPLWPGTLTKGTRVLVHTEQGYGDAIQMVRYLPLMAKAGVELHLETTRPLFRLFEGIPGLKSCILRGEPLPPVDFQLPIMGLPLAMSDACETIPGSVPYLSATDDAIRSWLNRLPDDHRPRVGVAWSGRLDLPVNRKRSCPAGIFSRILDLQGIVFVSLQKETDPAFQIDHPNLIDFSSEIGDFGDTAALLAGLDLVITIDTSVAHLAGAMGRPTWLMLPYVPDWRWLLEREDSHWYPTMRLYRQPLLGNWEPVIDSIMHDLNSLISSLVSPEMAGRKANTSAGNRSASPVAPEMRTNCINTSISLYGREIGELFQLGNSMMSIGKAKEAADVYRSVIALDPMAADGWHNLGHASKTVNAAEAEHAFRMAVRLAPANNDFLYSLAEFYLRQERFEESLALSRKILEADSGEVCALIAAGHAYQQLFMADEARKCYEESLARVPGDPFALNNLGVIFREQGLLDKSRNCFESIIARDPNDGDAHWNLSHTLLLDGNLAVGWKEYEWRFNRTASIPLPQFTQPRWQGEDLNGRTIFLWAEQAYGDTIQFIRFAPLLAARGATVLVEVQDNALQQLLRTVSGVSGVVVRGEPLPCFDCWTPLMSLPMHLVTELSTIPADIPYLSAPLELASIWQERMADSRPRIGLVWAGRSRPDPRRSCPASEFARFADLKLPVRCFLLQVGGSQDDKEMLSERLGAEDLSPQFTDFSETAAAIANLDLVITIDSAVAHLAGALGKETWLLLPFAPDWRWLLGRSDSPWYPTMRIFRQNSPGGWRLVIDEVIQSLGSFANGKSASEAILAAEAMIAMGDEAREIENWEEAAEFYRQALNLNPGSALAALCLGGSLIFLKRESEACSVLRRAIELEPENITAHINLAMASLAMGDFRNGWREFEWRLRNIEQPLPAIPMLDRGTLEEGLYGMTVLVHAEQGFGDMLQFCRYLPILSSCGAKVVVSLPVPLVRLFVEITGVDRVIPHGELLPSADYQCLPMSLPLLLEGVCREIPAVVPYLKPPEELVRFWRHKLPEDGRLKVGIVWSGRDLRKSGYRRSLKAEDYRAITELPGIAFFSLQTGERAAEIGMLGGEVVDLSPELVDFADTAAIIANLDLVITVDTSVAHLAGSMGKSVWVALLHAPDWRWLPDAGEATPWYPTMRLFRQDSPGDWFGVMQRIESELRLFLAEHLRRVAMERYRAGNLADAAKLFESLLALHPNDVDALFCLGTIALREGDPVAAERHFTALAAEDPDADGYNNLGHALGNQGRFDEAVAAFRMAIELDPQHAGARLNLGIYLHAAGRHVESRETLLHLVSHNPDYAEAWQNLGLAHQALGEIAEAFAAIGNALRIRPDYPTATWNLSLLQLLCGNYAEGFHNFEARFCKAGAIAARFSSIPRWQGEDIAGRSLLVHAEQGFGDTIQFVRYLPLLAERGIPVVMEVQAESLREAVESVPGGHRVIVRGEDPGNPEFQIPLLSLPRAFGTDLQSVPSTPYLFAPQSLLAKWQRIFSDTDRYRVGIVWRGRTTPDPYRSIPVELLSPLLELPGIGWYSLQVEEDANREAPAAIDSSHIPALTDFAETAACMKALDLVISIDTAAAHLAGALGIPAWVLLPFAPDWRWLLDREDSPWYPSMRLFRQAVPRDWLGVVQRVARALTTVLLEKKSS